MLKRFFLNRQSTLIIPNHEKINAWCKKNDHFSFFFTGNIEWNKITKKKKKIKVHGYQVPVISQIKLSQPEIKMFLELKVTAYKCL